MSPPRYTPLRRVVQASFALLFLWAALRGGWLAGSAIAWKVGSFDLLEPASALSAVVASRGAGVAWAAVALGVAPLVAATLTLGGVYCGWVCPYGLLSEGLDRLRRGPLARWTGRPWERARRPRAVALALVLALSAVAALPLAALVAPPRVLSALPAEVRVLGAVPALTLGLLAVAVALDLLVSRRIVCRVLCPAGGLMSLLRVARLGWRPRFEATRCSCPGPPPCLVSCRWGIDPRAAGPRDGCTSCLACVERCPSGALRLRRR
jgi:ferredoxin-type protein NapH